MGYKLKRILLWVPKRDTQGPCPDGFHVPNNIEWSDIISVGITLGAWISGGGSDFSTLLKVPLSGDRDWSGTTTFNQGSIGFYRTCTPDSTNMAYVLQVRSNQLEVANGFYYRGYGHTIRPFKDMPVVPDSSWTALYQGTGTAGIYHNSSLGLISMSSDGSTRYTIADKNLGATTVYNSGDTLSESNCGKYYQRGNNYGFAWTGSITTSNTQVDGSTYGPGNYYNSSTFITKTDWSNVQNDNLRGGVTQGKSVEKQVRPALTPITTPGIYHNSDLGLISLSSDGSNRITIADKNLGATTVYNSGDTMSEANCGKYYQWGNNYGFPWSGATSTTSTLPNLSNYGPGNYYSSSAFITGANGVSSVYNNNLRGGSTGTVAAMRGPCDEGYHIPSYTELQNFVSVYTSLVGDAINMVAKLKMPICGALSYQSGARGESGRTYIWASTSPSSTAGAGFLGTTGTCQARDGVATMTMGCSIRPFKNESVQPDSSWTKLY